MVGRPRQKVFCQGMTRASQRIGKPRQCRMKGYPLANGTYKCKYHGAANILGFKNTNYTDDTRIKQLSKLYQFRNKTIEEVKSYYFKEVKPRITTNQKSRYFHKQSYARKNSYGVHRGQENQSTTDQLSEVLRYLKKKS
jgi:hypothetical protein